MSEKVRIVCILTDPEECPHLLVAKYFDCCTGCEYAREKVVGREEMTEEAESGQPRKA